MELLSKCWKLYSKSDCETNGENTFYNLNFGKSGYNLILVNGFCVKMNVVGGQQLKCFFPYNAQMEHNRTGTQFRLILILLRY